jgi:SPP1 gp7 family putative phage head morphogenesis protein
MARRRQAKPVRPSRGAEVVYRRTLRAIVYWIRSVVLHESGLDVHTDAASGWTVRILYGAAWKNESLSTEEAANARAAEIKAQGYPVEVFPPGPLPPVAQSPDDVIRKIRMRVGERLTPEFLRRVTEAPSRTAKKAALKRLGASLAVPVTETPGVAGKLEIFAVENAALIRSLADDAIADLAKTVQEAHASGMLTRDLRAQIEERLGVSRSRADLIARDQIGKLNGAIVETKHREAGITRYMWSTSDDEKVRATHKALDKSVHSWDDPPEVSPGRFEHPGGDFQCRCSAIPIFEGA